MKTIIYAANRSFLHSDRNQSKIRRNAIIELRAPVVKPVHPSTPTPEPEKPEWKTKRERKRVERLTSSSSESPTEQAATESST